MARQMEMRHMNHDGRELEILAYFLLLVMFILEQERSIYRCLFVRCAVPYRTISPLSDKGEGSKAGWSPPVDRIRDIGLSRSSNSNCAMRKMVMFPGGLDPLYEPLFHGAI